MRDPYKKHRSRNGGNLPLCSGVAASSGNSIELSTAFPYASLDGHQVLLHLVLPNHPPHPQSHQEHSQSNLHLTLKCPCSSCSSFSPSNPWTLFQISGHLQGWSMDNHFEIRYCIHHRSLGNPRAESPPNSWFGTCFWNIDLGLNTWAAFGSLWIDLTISQKP